MGGGADDGSYISTGLSYVGVVWVDSGWLFSNDGGGMTGHALLPVAVAGCRTASASSADVVSLTGIHVAPVSFPSQPIHIQYIHTLIQPNRSLSLLY